MTHYYITNSEGAELYHFVSEDQQQAYFVYYQYMLSHQQSGLQLYMSLLPLSTEKSVKLINVVMTETEASSYEFKATKD